MTELNVGGLGQREIVRRPMRVIVLATERRIETKKVGILPHEVEKVAMYVATKSCSIPVKPSHLSDFPKEAILTTKKIDGDPAEMVWVITVDAHKYQVIDDSAEQK